MRRIILAVTALAAPLLGCDAFFHFGQYTTAATEDAGDQPAKGASSRDAQGEAPTDAAGGSDAADAGGAECRTNADCAHSSLAPIFAGADASDLDADGPAPDAGSPTICVKATGKCARLLTSECPRVQGDYENDDAVFVGTMLTTDDAPQDLSIEQAAWQAAAELNSPAAGGLPPSTVGGAARPLVVLSCDRAGDALAAANHLVHDLHVPAIVGPRMAEDVVEVTQQVSTKGETLLISPTSLASALSNLVDDDLTWRDVPADGQRAKLVIEQMNEIENVLHATRGPSVKLGILHKSDEAGTSAYNAISGKLIINGHFISDPTNAAYVHIDTYPEVGHADALGAVLTRYTRDTPDIIFVTAPEQVINLVVPLEQALTAARAVNRPYYVCTDAVKTDDFLAQLASPNVPADIKRRIRGVGVKPDTASQAIFDTFNSTYEHRYGHNPNSSGTAAAYDAIYAVAYATLAAPATLPSGISVARGLRSLGVGDTFAVGAGQARSIMQSLSAGKSISLRGSFGLMQWDSSGDIVGGTVEVWCIGNVGGAMGFGSSGLTMDVETQVVGGGFVQCQ